MPFDTLLIANRGRHRLPRDPNRRAFDGPRRWPSGSSDADRDALHVRMAELLRSASVRDLRVKAI
jgi:hypothetical protein